MAQPIVSKLTYLAREVTPGTRAAPNKYLQGLNLRVVKNTTRGMVRPSGSLLSAGRPKIQDWSTFTIADGSYLDYNSIIYALAAMLGLPTTTTPGGGNGYGRNLDTSATLGVNEVQTITITGTPTGGTFTITYAGQTTAAIAYDAAASAVDSALEALSNIGVGDVTVTGGPGPGTPWVVTFGGALANTNVAQMTTTDSLTGGTAPASAVATTQAGGITTVPVEAIQAPEWDVFIDDTAGGIGGTQVDVYSGAFNFGGLTNPEWVVNSQLPSYKGDILQVPDIGLDLVLPNEAAARTLLSSLDGGATKYVRFQAEGDDIETGQPHLFRVDCAVQADENLGQFGDEGGAETIPFPLTVLTDSGFASGGFQALVRNGLASL